MTYSSQLFCDWVGVRRSGRDGTERNGGDGGDEHGQGRLVDATERQTGGLAAVGGRVGDAMAEDDVDHESGAVGEDEHEPKRLPGQTRLIGLSRGIGTSAGRPTGTGTGIARYGTGGPRAAVPRTPPRQPQLLASSPLSG